ncbi:MAG TPA: TRIC cation channel family protein, partial [Puia sp.]|nr:TRIC cation channel family protein [Puia sp.]
LFFGSRLQQMQKVLNIFDSLGLGLFTIIGIQKGLSHNLSPSVCIALGTITGCFGGVIRDVFLNKVPLIFHKEIYASASIAGGSIYFLLTVLKMPAIINASLSIIFIFIIRMIVVRYKLNLPVWNTPKL